MSSKSGGDFVNDTIMEMIQGQKKKSNKEDYPPPKVPT